MNVIVSIVVDLHGISKFLDEERVFVADEGGAKVVHVGAISIEGM